MGLFLSRASDCLKPKKKEAAYIPVDLAPALLSESCVAFIFHGRFCQVSTLEARKELEAGGEDEDWNNDFGQEDWEAPTQVAVRVDADTTEAPQPVPSVTLFASPVYKKPSRSSASSSSPAGPVGPAAAAAPAGNRATSPAPVEGSWKSFHPSPPSHSRTPSSLVLS